ncbi:MAG: hypothetical protein JWN29_249 [Acidimicrobiales bacterium]|nr:hypothetical protein [Acidimicrobiales bacterium]
MTDTQSVEQGAEVAGRIGLVARGVVYCLLAVLAIQVAAGDRSEEADRQGALRAVARQPFGTVLLVALTIGFAGYALWRFAEAVLGHDELPKRLLHAARGLLYAGFTVTSARLVLGRKSGGGSDSTAKDWSARLMEHGWGRPLVVVVGLGLLVGGGVLAWRGWHQTFEKHLRTGEMTPSQRRRLPWLGTFGNAARGVVLALIGLFLVRAALDFDPNKAVGVDGALHQLADRPYGTVALVIVALGLFAYGLFSFVEARWRKVME